MSDELRLKARARITAVATVMDGEMGRLTDVLHKGLAEGIEDLKGDAPILELLRASIASNLETLADIMRYDIAVDEVSSPSAAEEYARRLAQRGISSIALVRAYRLGQQLVLAWSFEEIARQEKDPQVAYAAAQVFTDLTFAYVDSISEQVVREYEAEREKWPAERMQPYFDRVKRLREIARRHEHSTSITERQLHDVSAWIVRQWDETE